MLPNGTSYSTLFQIPLILSTTSSNDLRFSLCSLCRSCSNRLAPTICKFGAGDAESFEIWPHVSNSQE